MVVCVKTNTQFSSLHFLFTSSFASQSPLLDEPWTKMIMREHYDTCEQHEQHYEQHDIDDANKNFKMNLKND